MVFAPILLVATFLQAVQSPDPPGSITLAGVVLDARGEPVGGAEVWLSGIGGFGSRTPVLSRAATDAEGHFRVIIPPDKDGRRSREVLTIWAHRPGSAVGMLSFERGRPPAPEATTLSLGGPSESRFRVVGPDGRPVGDAKVAPFDAWAPGRPYSPPMPRELADRLASRTDAEGKGAFTALMAGSPGNVCVESGSFGAQVVGFKPGEAGVATITLAAVGRVSGRLVSDDPLAARNVTIDVRTVSGSIDDPRSGKAEITTGADGRFEVPALAVGSLRFFVRTGEKDGRAWALRSGRRSVAAGELTEIEIALDGPPRMRTIAGVVRDRRGRPVAGAVVSQSGDGPKRTGAATDEGGRFRLPDVHDGRAFVLVKKEGFHFQGRLIERSPSEVEVVLARSGEPPSLALQTLPSLLPRDEELSLARRLIDPYLERVLKDGDEGAKVRTIEALARANPACTLELLEKKLFTDPFYNDMFRMRIVEGLAAESPDEAADVIESMQSPFTKALAYVHAGDALPASGRARRLEMLDRATLQARGTKEPQFRLASLSEVADRLLDLGETDRATKLLREGQAVAKELPNAAWAGYAKGAFAEELAQIDVTGALELTRDLSDAREFDRHHGNMAHELARTNPAEAERILGMMRDPSQRDYSAVRVCYRMARPDLARARRIAGSIKEPLKRAYAHGMMAQSLAGLDKPAALGLLAEAYDALDRIVESGQAPFNGMDDAAATGATLLPAVEAADPNSLPDYFWRSLSLRRPETADRSQEGGRMQADAVLAMRLARYDRGVARAILEPAADRLKGAGDDFGGGDPKATLVAAAVVDPRWAVALIEAMPDPPDPKLHQAKNAARLGVVNMLTRRGDRRWQHLQWNYLHSWVPDREDIGDDF